MKKSIIVAVIILPLFIFLSACATAPKSREDQAAYHASQARAAISKGDITKAVDQIDIALTLPTGDTRIKELFANYPKGKDYYREYLAKSIQDISSRSQVADVLDKLSTAKSARIFPEDHVCELFSNLSKVVAEGNKTGSVPFDLDDDIGHFPELKSPMHQQIMVNRTIKIIQGNKYGYRPVKPLMEYVQRVGVDSAEGQSIESLLPTFNIRRDELDIVAKVFPKFATARKEENTIRVFIQFKNGDRLLSEDILEALRNKVRGVEWVTSGDPKIITVVIERVRNDEKTLPETSQPITYKRTDVNIFDALLHMPRDASYLYEVVRGGAEIEYGYVVSAIAEGQTIHDEVVRGRVGGEYRRCQNSRIQNVFGGVSSAEFVANNDMQQRCSGPSSVSIEELRKEVFSQVVDNVLKVPPIKVIHEIN